MTHRQAQLPVALVLAIFFAPLLWQGEVIFVHDNRLEVGLPPQRSEDPPSVRKLSDQSSVYIPALHIQLRGAHTRWISAWNPHVELGRPTFHVSGFSKAFLLTRALALLSDDPLVVYTALAVLAVLLTVIFGYGLLRELGLAPAACAAGALWLGLGPSAVYWQSFVMLIWGICWTLALLWALTVHLRRPGPWSWLGIAASLHALLLTCCG